MPTALIVVDMLNAYDHEDAETLIPSTERALPRIRALVQRAADEGVPTMYVNDNFGDYTKGRPELLQTAREGKRPDLIDPIAPKDDVAFIAKARHSIFFGTPLEYVAHQQGIDRLVLCGQVTEQCILYSALDAHLRHIACVVPRDAVAHIDEELADAALRMMEQNMGAEVVDVDEVDFRDPA